MTHECTGQVLECSAWTCNNNQTILARGVCDGKFDFENGGFECHECFQKINAAFVGWALPTIQRMGVMRERVEALRKWWAVPTLRRRN